MHILDRLTFTEFEGGIRSPRNRINGISGKGQSGLMNWGTVSQLGDRVKYALC